MKLFIILALLAFAVFALVRGLQRIKKTGPSTSDAFNAETGEVYETERDVFADWKRSLKPLWSGHMTATFSYTGRNKPTSIRTVDIHQVLCAPRGGLYLLGYCHLRQEDRHFRVDRIRPKVECEGHRYFVDEFMPKFFGVEWEPDDLV